MDLVIAEKPSVARDLGRVLGARQKGDGYLEGNGLVVTWCVGHLAELEEPAHYKPEWRRWRLETLPMVPEQFSLRVRKGCRDRWTVVRRLLRDRRFSSVINACDAGREGELIFRQVYQLAESKLPVQRLWLSSMTDVAIRTAWGNLRDGALLEPLWHAAKCRSEADWLVGLNATRAMTCLVRQGGGDQVMSVGRVQTPTLAMVVERDAQIEGFVSEDFWQVKAQFEVNGEDETARWEGVWFRDRKEKRDKGDGIPHAQRLHSEESAKRLVGIASEGWGRVQTSESKRSNQAPPLLYDLTTLQQRANQRYGLAASQTLQVAQALYERHKLLSYPRTDARYLTPDQEATLPDIVGGLAGLSVYSSYCERLLDGPITPGKRVINGDEVGDHHAIIPTGKTPRSERLSADEKRVFDLVARRFLAALSPSAVVERTQIVVSLQDVDESQLPEEITMPVRFRAKGTVIVERGWREIDPPKKEREKSLPVIEPGSRADVVAAKAEKGQTKPPRRFNDGTLLKAMEHAGKQLDDAELKRAMRRSGLGTPATRAAILQTLLTRQFLIRKKRDLWSTERGRALIHAVPTPEMKSPELTGRFEARLSRIAEGTEPAEAFMSDVVVQVRDMVLAIGKAEPPAAECTSQPKGPELGVCPVCAKPVRERKAVFACDTGRSCSFVVFRTMARRKISTRMVKALLKNGRSEVVKGFKSRKGKPFSAGLTMKEDGTVGFFFPERASETSKSKPAERKPQALASGELSCPVCHQGRVIRGRTAWGCSRWREGCEARAPLEQKGRALTMDEVLKRLPLGPEGHHSG